MKLTQKQAITLGDTKFWEEMSPREIAEFQLQEPRLCMPFEVFHNAVGTALGRPVFTHEFADGESLLSELLGDRPTRTPEEVLAMIPKDKLIVLFGKTEPA